MTIKEIVADIVAFAQTKTSMTKTEEMQLTAKLLTLRAELVKDDLVVDADVFEVMDSDCRKIALTGFILLLTASMK